MKYKILSLMFLLHCINVFTQFGTQQIISTNAEDIRDIFAIDIDNDGDIDVLSASQDDHKIAWYENLDGLGNFSSEKIITSSAIAANSVVAADIDGDGDIDVISGAWQYGIVTWHENIDGYGNFNNHHIITSNANHVSSLHTSDIDNDGDIDILLTSEEANKLKLFKNNGSGIFIEYEILTIGLVAPRSIYTSDIDNDGDLDIISAWAGSNEIVWHENIDGNGTFGVQNIIHYDTETPNSVFSKDIDGDNDMDIIIASWYGDKIIWFENLDGLGSFNDGNIVTSNIDAPGSVYSIDLDNDNDNDIISCSFVDDSIVWYENIDGFGTFGNGQIITTNALAAYSVFAIDLDNDGFNDILSGSSFDDKIAWYKNLTTLNIPNNIILNYSIYPTPTNNVLNIKSKTEIIKIEVYSKLGQKIKETTGNKIDISNLTQGLYFVKVEDVNGNFGVKKIVKK